MLTDTLQVPPLELLMFVIILVRAQLERLERRRGAQKPPDGATRDVIAAIDLPTRDADGVLMNAGKVTLENSGHVFDNPLDIAAVHHWRRARS